MNVNFIIPGDINLPTGGYRYDKRIMQEWDNFGLKYNLISLQGEFPFPTDKTIANAIAEIGNFPDADISVVDGLAGGAMPGFMQQLSQSTPVVALVHHPLCMENGLSKFQATGLKRAESDGLDYTRGIVTTSPTTTKTVGELFGYDRKNIETVLPGVERGLNASPHSEGPLRILCIGSLIERKGHRYLINALAKLRDHNWILDCFGMLNQESALFKEIQQLTENSQLTERVHFHGSVSDERIELAYSQSHLFVLPSLYEGYGMAYAEAIVRGLPVIGTTAGAIPETVPKSCGILVKPESAEDLKKALHSLMTNENSLEKYRLGTLDAVDHFPTWQTSAIQFKDILEQWT